MISNTLSKMTGWPLQLSIYRELNHESKRLFEEYRLFLRQRKDYPGDVTLDSSTEIKDAYSLYIAFLIPDSLEEFNAAEKWFKNYESLIDEMERLCMRLPDYPFLI